MLRQLIEFYSLNLTVFAVNQENVFKDVLAACTRTVIREARLAEIRAEILRSKRLETYFAKNPREKSTLEHDRKLYTLSLHSPAIADVPNYIGNLFFSCLSTEIRFLTLVHLTFDATQHMV